MERGKDGKRVQVMARWGGEIRRESGGRKGKKRETDRAKEGVEPRN